ncbi:NADH/ubiquinone/plastoquinone [Intrasporangium chromatireducens Q5-1]|uniref:NADH/ubiquinone/plastoquinone n=1 Tax=Intrasporangium chromatireducens Q5-1 TaxID=584657 RepID=W9GMX9_9MICO|nr:NADH-quinone oxidoreductase subunit L [Intrasporangium chromatireducens]EWT06178.1 NADH/ubiquinone/plastoquinone [Intrasporangium chromatireducens Q5-1]
MTWVVRLIVVVPAIAGLAGLLLGRSRPIARGIAVGAAAATTVLALAQWVAPLRTADVTTFGALPLGDLSVPLHLLSDRLSGLVSFVVALVVLAIQTYTVWYLRDDRRYPPFAAGVSLFAAGMLLVVQSSDLVLTLVGWEIMGWCSWLLIGHDSERAAARRAAYKAFLVTRVADVAMVVGLVTLSVRARSTDLLAVITQPEGAALLTFGLVCVVIGVAGKSGLVPFQDWLPDAMEGPTPASALIHAATMVAAGTYVIARLFTLYAADDAARTVLAVLAAVTMVYAAGLAFAQADLKRLLAYSTLSQVAIMLAALAAAPASVGVGPGIGHLIGHAFFKALLFLGAGWLAALVGSTALAAMAGRGRSDVLLRWGMAIGLAALAGVPPLVGFFTKDTVIDAALEGIGDGAGFRAWVVAVALFATVLLTAAYCMRAWLLLDTPPPAPTGVTEGTEGSLDVEAVAARETERPLDVSERHREPEAVDETPPARPDHHPLHAEPHESRLPAQLREAQLLPLLRTVSVAALAALTVLGALLLLTLAGSLHVGWLSALVSVLLIAGAAGAVWAASRRGARDAADVVPDRVRAGAVAGYGADAAYAALGRAVIAVARLVVVLDRDVVDAYPRAFAATAHAAGRAGVRTHRAVPSVALIGVVAGVLLVAVLGVTAWR